MKNNVKIVIYLLILVFSATCMFSCKSGKEESDSGDNTTSNYTTINMEGVGETDGTVVANGTSDYKIVVSSESTVLESLAANELQKYLTQSVGVVLPIVNDEQIEVGTFDEVFSIGNNGVYEYLSKLEDSGLKNIDYSNFNRCGFIMKTYGKTIIINGANDTGTLYGVYDYLEKLCGIRFLEEDYAYVPSLSDLAFRNLNVTEIPAFPYREYYAVGNGLSSQQNRISGTLGDHVKWCDVEGYNAIHNTLIHVPVNVYYTADKKEQNAHLYTRQSEDDVPENPVEICWTDGINEDGSIDETMALSSVKIVIEAIKKFALQDTDAEFFMIGQEDQGTTCQCDQCKKMDKKYGRGGISMRFANAVAREIKKWSDEYLNGRTINIVIFAYWYSDYAPVKDGDKGDFLPIDQTVMADDNVFIRLAPIDSTMFYPITDSRQNARYHNWAEKWSVVANHFFIWAYTANFSNTYGYWCVIQSFKKDLQTYRDMGVECIMYQDQHMMPGSWQVKMRRYVASKMFWNPNLDALALRDEWIRLYFGDEAYPYLDKLMTDVDEYFATQMNSGISVFDTDIFSYKYWSAPQLRKHLSWLNEAKQEVNESEADSEQKNIYIEHIDMVRLTPLCMILLNYDIYYMNDTAGKIVLAREFFRINDSLGVKNSGIDGSLSQIRTQLGI